MNTDETTTNRVAEAGWQRMGDADGTPFWQWQEDSSVRVVTHDHMVLSFAGAALNLREEMTDSEQAQFLGRYLLGGRSGMPSDEHPPPTEDTGPGQYIAAS